MIRRLIPLAAALCVACGSADDAAEPETSSAAQGTTPAAGSQEPAPSSQAAPASRRPIDPNTTGAVRGTVRFQGEAPEIRVLESVPEQPGCHEGHDEPPISEFFVVRNGAVQNVVVYVDAGLDAWEVPPAPAASQRLTQRGCVYRPHVLGMRTGQTLIVENEDPTNHNVNARARKNKSFNQNQGPGGQDIEVVLDKAEIVPLQCDIHPWMGAHVAVFEHPFFAITGSDGSFLIEGLPPGEFQLEALHPDNKKIGKRGKLTQSVTVTAGKTSEIAFDF